DFLSVEQQLSLAQLNTERRIVIFFLTSVKDADDFGVDSVQAAVDRVGEHRHPVARLHVKSGGQAYAEEYSIRLVGEHGACFNIHRREKFRFALTLNACTTAGDGGVPVGEKSEKVDSWKHQRVGLMILGRI